MKKILGISAFYHDSSACISIGGEIIAAAQEERFTREKNTSIFPKKSILFCLNEAGLDINDLDAIVFYDKPLLKFERIIQTYFSFAPKGLISFVKSIPLWLNEKLFLKRLIYNGLKEIGEFEKTKITLLFNEHHLSHAASSFYPSVFDKAAILTIDAVGEWCTSSIAVGEGNNIKIIREMQFPHSVGLLYSSFTYFLGFKVNSGEYKLMGLASYGNINSKNSAVFIELIKNKLIDIKEDGSIWINQKYFKYSTGLSMINEKLWENLFGLKKRNPESEINQIYCDLALAIQKVTEEIILKMVKEAKKITGLDNLCLAGGVALNCVSNGAIVKEKIFSNIYIPPAPGDSGGSVGACLSINYLFFNQKRKINYEYDSMKGSYLGPYFSKKEINLMNKKVNAVYKFYDSYKLINSLIAKNISDGKVVGWFQGRMEFGPRSLGNRSIIADARNPAMQKKINLKIKFREGFRPFAPSVLEHKAQQYFDLKTKSPYMLLVSDIASSQKLDLPSDYANLDLWNKLYTNKSFIPSVTHVDFSSRVQTVSKRTNPLFYNLISEFENQTGHSLLINTSFNVRGEPIVCSPLDAYNCFMKTDMDILVINKFVYLKDDQKNENIHK